MGSILAGHRAGGRMRPALFRWDGSAAFQVTTRTMPYRHYGGATDLQSDCAVKGVTGKNCNGTASGK